MTAVAPSSPPEAQLALRSYLVADALVGDPFAGLQDPAGMLPADLAGWQRQLRENPEGSGPDLALVLALDGSRVVGRLGCFAGRAHIGGQSVKGLFLSGFALEPDYRQTGAGALLLMRVLSASRTIFTAGAPDENARALYRRLGFVELGPLRRFLLPLRASIPLGYLSGSPAIGRLAGVLAQPVLSAYLRVIGRRSGRLTLRPSAAFPASGAALLQRETRDIFPRSEAHYRWAAPGNRHFEVLHGNDVVGFVVLTKYIHPGGGRLNLPRTSIAALKDYYLAPEHRSLAPDLMREVIRLLRGSGADMIECQVAEPEMIGACERLGLRQRGGDRVFVRHRGSTTDAGRWLVTYAVGDHAFT